jgi:hypothetical protein
MDDPPSATDRPGISDRPPGYQHLNGEFDLAPPSRRVQPAAEALRVVEQLLSLAPAPRRHAQRDVPAAELVERMIDGEDRLDPALI